MRKASRQKTRRFLFQALYSKAFLREDFNKDDFLLSFFDKDYGDVLDIDYFDTMFLGIPKKEAELTYVIERFASRFNVASMSISNILPVFIASYEMLFLAKNSIPDNVSIDEALELTKIYSDDHGRMLVNGILNSLKENKKDFKKDLIELKKQKDQKNQKTKKHYFFNIDG